MKKLIVILLALVLLTNLALTVVMVQNNRILTKILEASIVSRTETPAAQQQDQPSETPHAQIPMPPAAQQQNGETEELIRVCEDKYLEADGAWHFHFAIQNTTDTDLFIHSLTFIDNGGHQDYRDITNDPPLFEMMMGPNYAESPLAPGEVMVWNDGHPGEDLTDRTYLFAFIDANGKTYTARYEYNLIMEVREGPSAQMPEFSTDSGKDLITLRHDAAFEMPVAPDVFWVPVRALGESRYANQEIFAMLGETPQIKQREIASLYEALQLYQVGGFVSSDDNIRMEENGIFWEHHKPGFAAVSTNNGCCATSANWLNYILAGDYDEIGFIATSQQDGNGHIYNYIFHDGWYYFIDLTHYRTDWIATAVESGDGSDYFSTDFILGNLHKCRTVEAYVNYVQNTFGDPPGLMFQYTAADCLAIDSKRAPDGVTILYEDDPAVTLNVIFNNPDDALSHAFAPQPSVRPNWE